MLGDHRHNDHRVFAALAFVNGDGIGQHQLMQFMEIVNHLARHGSVVKVTVISLSSKSRAVIRPISPCKHPSDNCCGSA